PPPPPGRAHPVRSPDASAAPARWLRAVRRSPGGPGATRAMRRRPPGRAAGPRDHCPGRRARPPPRPPGRRPSAPAPRPLRHPPEAGRPRPGTARWHRTPDPAVRPPPVPPRPERAGRRLRRAPPRVPAAPTPLAARALHPRRVAGPRHPARWRPPRRLAAGPARWRLARSRPPLPARRRAAAQAAIDGHGGLLERGVLAMASGDHPPARARARAGRALKAALKVGYCRLPRQPRTHAPARARNPQRPLARPDLDRRPGPTGRAP